MPRAGCAAEGAANKASARAANAATAPVALDELHRLTEAGHSRGPRAACDIGSKSRVGTVDLPILLLHLPIRHNLACSTLPRRAPARWPAARPGRNRDYTI